MSSRRDRNRKIDELHDEIQLLNTKNGEHSLFLEENSAIITSKLKEYNDKKTSILHNKSTMESQIKSIVKDSVKLEVFLVSTMNEATSFSLL